MEILKKIKNDYLVARKTKNAIAKNILGVLIGEIEGDMKRPDIEVTEDYVIKKIKKLIKSNIESNSLDENKFIEVYLPQTLSDDLIKDYATRFLYNLDEENIGMRSMGAILKGLNSMYPGQVDGKVASGIIRNLILEYIK